MKVLSVRGNKVSFDFTEDECHTLLRYGLQLYIDKEYGKDKIRVDSVNPSTKYDKAHTFEMPDVMANECLSMAVNQALLEGIERLEKEDKKVETSAVFCEHANENPSKCKCPKGCYCKKHSCKRKIKK